MGCKIAAELIVREVRVLKRPLGAMIDAVDLRSRYHNAGSARNDCREAA